MRRLGHHETLEKLGDAGNSRFVAGIHLALVCNMASRFSRIFVVILSRNTFFPIESDAIRVSLDGKGGEDT
jgi:hypothetical protein